MTIWKLSQMWVGCRWRQVPRDLPASQLSPTTAHLYQMDDDDDNDDGDDDDDDDDDYDYDDDNGYEGANKKWK